MRTYRCSVCGRDGQPIVVDPETKVVIAVDGTMDKTIIQCLECRQLLCFPCSQRKSSVVVGASEAACPHCSGLVGRVNDALIPDAAAPQAAPPPKSPAKQYGRQQALARQYARDWWAAYPNRHDAICDRCNGALKRPEGCLVLGMGVDLVCDECFNENTHTPANFNVIRTGQASPREADDFFSELRKSELGAWLLDHFSKTSVVVIFSVACAASFFGAIYPFIWWGDGKRDDQILAAFIGFFVGAIGGGMPSIAVCWLVERLRWMGVLLLLVATGLGGYFLVAHDWADLRLADDFPARHLALSHDGQLALAARGTEIRCWDAKTGQWLHTFQARNAVERLAFSKDGLRVLAFEAAIVGKSDSLPQAWSATSGESAAATPDDGLLASTRRVAYSLDGRLTLAARKDQLSAAGWFIECRDAKTSLELTTHYVVGSVDRVAFSKDGLRVLVFEAPANGKPATLLQAWSTTGFQPVAATPDDRLLASAPPPPLALEIDGNDIALRVGPKGSILHVLKGHTGPVRQVVLSPDALMALSWADDHSLLLWKTAPFNVAYNVKIKMSPEKLFRQDPLGKELRRWEAKEGSLLRFSAELNLLAAGERRVDVWDMNHVGHLKTWNLKWTEPILADVAISGDGQTILTANGTNVRVWRLK